MRDQLLNALQRLQLADNLERKAAEEYIVSTSQNNFQELISLLFDILTDKINVDLTLKMTAGMVLKMFFVWESADKRDEVNARWMSLPEGARVLFKQRLLDSLKVCSGRIGDIIAQCLSAVAKVEVVNGRWPDVFKDLIAIYSQTVPLTNTVKKNVIDAIGHLCLDITGMEEKLIMGSSGSILTVIINGTRSGDDEIKLCSFRSLERSLGFIAYNIELENECLAIVETLYTGCKDSNAEVATKALECFIGALFMYYKQVSKYIKIAFGAMAMEFLSSNTPEKVVMAIEMWGVVTDYEIENEGDIIAEAFPALARELLPMLVNEGLEQIEEWEPHKAAAWLLTLMCECAPERVKEEIAVKETGKTMALVLAIERMLLSDKPDVFEAGMIALGSVLNERTANDLGTFVRKISPVVFKALLSPDPAVLDTGLWVFEKLFKHAYGAVGTAKSQEEVITKIIEILNTNPGGAVNAAWALAGIVSAIRAEPPIGDEDEIILFTKYTEIVTIVLGRFFRLMKDEYTLRVALSSAACEIINAAPEKNHKVVLGVVSDMLSHTKTELTNDKPNEEAISCFLSVIQACISSCSSQILVSAQDIVEVSLYILSHPQMFTLYTDAYLTLGTLGDTIGIEFCNYTERVIEYVVRDLSRLEGLGVEGEGFPIFSTTLVTFIGSMASATQLGFGAYVDVIVPRLIRAVSSPGLPREAKVTAVTAFADISLAIGKIFDKYIGSMFSIALSIISVEDDGTDSNFILMLRESLLDLLSCIIQSSNGKNPMIGDNVTVILEVIKKIITETTDSTCVVKSLYLISDLWMLYGTTRNTYITQQLDSRWIADFIAAKAQSANKEVKEAAITTRAQINTATDQEY
ncbi:importin subunit beta-1 [Nematocida displodere]|uniref:Importin subunit beta-1 n=1 Tax=Nematocida displodere TaxID=1805483 RepID=A0A177EBG1_9MICR|nr:importin subunit beta-1 [Nematocida displodere]